MIVGVYLDLNFNQHGFVLPNGVYTTVDVPRSTATDINSIDPQGDIAGYYVVQINPNTSDTHGFVGTPTEKTAKR